MPRSGLLRPGDRIDGYEVVDRAPVDIMGRSRTREIGGHTVTGSWSDPCWAYDPARGWALTRRWRSKDAYGMVPVNADGSPAEAAGRGVRWEPAITVPARDERVTVPWPPERWLPEERIYEEVRG
jgi:hypothetical protein